MTKRWVALLALLFFVATTPASALTAAKKAAASGGCPSASRVAGGPCNALNFNFQTGMYWAQGQGYQPLSNFLTVTRACAGTGCQATNLLSTSASGFAYSTYAANVPVLDSNGFLPFEARTQQLSASAAPATQTTGSLATGTYNLWVNGSGSATMSAGTGTGCGTSAASQGVVVTFTITVAGTCTVTVAGSLNAFELDLGAFPGPFIKCTTAPCSRGGDVPQLIGAAASAAVAAKAAFFQTTGMTNTAGSRMLEYSGGFINYFSSTTIAKTFFSGANKATTTFGSGSTAGLVKVAIGFDTSGTSIIANNGTKGTDATALVGNTGNIYIGNNAAGAFALNGYMQRFALSPVKGIFDNATAP